MFPFLMIGLTCKCRYVPHNTGGKSVQVWDVERGKLIRTIKCCSTEPFPMLNEEKHVTQITCAALTADGKRVITAGKDGTTRAWNVSTGDFLCMAGEFKTCSSRHEYGIYGLDISGDSRWMVRYLDGVDGLRLRVPKKNNHLTLLCARVCTHTHTPAWKLQHTPQVAGGLMDEDDDPSDREARHRLYFYGVDHPTRFNSVQSKSIDGIIKKVRFLRQLFWQSA